MTDIIIALLALIALAFITAIVIEQADAQEASEERVTDRLRAYTQDSEETR